MKAQGPSLCLYFPPFPATVTLTMLLCWLHAVGGRARRFRHPLSDERYAACLLRQDVLFEQDVQNTAEDLADMIGLDLEEMIGGLSREIAKECNLVS